ncbi:relaxase/mobilization nuclease domain-containing protein, partial [Erwinia amylovora]|uniref:relaxase/mobilization nuclease domain-containing protein n=1 Tax=Erwinia amylovora TaxID=552 RepID=UPI003BAC830F
TLRITTDEKHTKQEVIAIAEKYMKRMGFCDTHQRSYFRQDDEDEQHIQIIASRINVVANGQLYRWMNDKIISTRIRKEHEIDP